MLFLAPHILLPNFPQSDPANWSIFQNNFLLPL